MLVLLVLVVISVLVFLGLLVILGFCRARNKRQWWERLCDKSDDDPPTGGAPCDLLVFPARQAIVDSAFTDTGSLREMQLLPKDLPLALVTNSGLEAETHCAADSSALSQGQRYIAAVSDFSIRGGFNTTVYSYTVNGGKTWSTFFVPYDVTTARLVTGDGRDWAANSDPTVAYSCDGSIAYFCSLYFNTSDAANGIYVGTAPSPSNSSIAIFNNRMQIHPVVVNPIPTSADAFEDKPWIATAPDHPKTIYASWTRFTATTAFIVISKSVDSGVTWSSPIQASDPKYNGAVQGSQIVVGKNGLVFVIYMAAYISGFRAQIVARSCDGGKTFPCSAQITPIYLGLTFTSTYRKESFASATYNCATQTLHVAFSGTSNSGHARVYYVRVRGTNLSSSNPKAPIIVGGNQFMPAIGCNSKGVVGISWTNTCASNQFIDCFAIKSVDDGVTWSKANQLSSTTVDVDSTPFIGDYNGTCVGTDGRALATFSYLLGPPMQTVFF